MESLDALREADILCKVNSVMIPGINDEHLVEVNRVIQSKGAFLHNIMPLISAPEHGTHFGLTGQRGPTPKELKTLQDKCSGNMKMMRHCRQCRADAVGLLGEDRSQEFTKDKILDMKPEYDSKQRQDVHASIEKFTAEVNTVKEEQNTQITSDTSTPSILVAVATKGNRLVNQHFGHATEFQIFEVNGTDVKFIAHRKVDHYCQSGYGEETSLDSIIKSISDCKGVLASKIGLCPQEALRNAGLEPYEAYDIIDNVAINFYKEYMQKQTVGA
jgi:nitrogen fixation protein NifB